MTTFYNEKPLSEMTQDEIIAEINGLRERRAAARERKQVERSLEKSKVPRAGPVEVSGELGSLLDDILGDSHE